MKKDVPTATEKTLRQERERVRELIHLSSLGDRATPEQKARLQLLRTGSRVLPKEGLHKGPQGRHAPTNQLGDEARAAARRRMCLVCDRWDPIAWGGAGSCRRLGDITLAALRDPRSRCPEKLWR